MFTNLIVATDLSPASDAVVSCLHGLKLLGTRKVILFHALGLRHLEVMKYELTRLVEPKLQAQQADIHSSWSFSESIDRDHGTGKLHSTSSMSNRASTLRAKGTNASTLEVISPLAIRRPTA